jgi:cytochrome P450
MYGPSFGADPDSHYAQLRSFGLSAPVDIAPDVQAELVTSYDAALYVLQNPASFVRDSRRWNALNEGRVPADSPALPMMAYRPNALFSDGAAHARLRQAVTDSLATVNEHQLIRQTQQSANYLISQFSTDIRGQAELMAEYAQPLPLLVFSDLFGCPPEIGDRVIAGISGIFEGTPGSDEVLGGALTELIALKRRRPAADLTTRLLGHPAQLSDEEVLHQLVTLLSGGTAPLAAAIGTSSALYLGEDWQAGLPVEDAVSQTLWNYAPIANYAAHYPTHDVELGGRAIRANDPVRPAKHPRRYDKGFSVDRPARHIDDLAGDEPRAGTHEVGRRMGDVLRLTHSADRNGLCRVALELLEAEAQPTGRGPGHVAHHEARGDRVGGDPVPAELQGERLGEAEQTRLRAAVVDTGGATARVTRNGPRRLTPRTASHCSVVISTRSARGPTPALLTSTVGGPSSSATRATAAVTATSSATSAATAVADPPSSLMACTVPAQSASSRSITPTARPSRASCRATAAPMPRAAPVTMAVPRT